MGLFHSSPANYSEERHSLGAHGPSLAPRRGRRLNWWEVLKLGAVTVSVGALQVTKLYLNETFQYLVTAYYGTTCNVACQLHLQHQHLYLKNSEGLSSDFETSPSFLPSSCILRFNSSDASIAPLIKSQSQWCLHCSGSRFTS